MSSHDYLSPLCISPSFPFSVLVLGLGSYCLLLRGFQVHLLSSGPCVDPRSIRIGALPGGRHGEAGRGTGRAPPETSRAEPTSASRDGLPRCPRPRHRSRGPSSPPLGLTCSGTAWCPPATCSSLSECTFSQDLEHPGTGPFGCLSGKTPRHSARTELVPSHPSFALCLHWWTGRSLGGRNGAGRRQQRKNLGGTCHRGPY